MRNRELVRAQNPITEQKQVDVECTRSEANLGAPVAPEVGLQRMTSGEQLRGLPLEMPAHNGVQEIGLCNPADRRGSIYRRNARTRQYHGKPRDHLAEEPHGIADVSAETEIYELTHFASSKQLIFSRDIVNIGFAIRTPPGS